MGIYKNMTAILAAALLLCGCSGSDDTTSAEPVNASSVVSEENSQDIDESSQDTSDAPSDDSIDSEEINAGQSAPVLTGSSDKESFTLKFAGIKDADGIRVNVYYPAAGQSDEFDIEDISGGSFVLDGQKSGVQGIFTVTPYRYEDGETVLGITSNELKLTTMRDKMMLNIKSVCQYAKPTLPTGCECTALTTVLGFYGINIPKTVIALVYLDKVPFEEKKGKLIGADPEEAFVGDPTDENSYGCYSKPIANAANRLFEDMQSDLKAQVHDGERLSYWFEYVNNGTPVLVWTTTGLAESVKTDTWETKDGKKITWLQNEHCVVLAGFDTKKGEVYVCDPLCRNTTPVKYDMKLFEKRYNEQGKRAVLITNE